MALRLKDIIQFPTMKGIKIITGHDSLDRIVRWVHVIEIPEVTEWVNGGELVFITGIGLKNGANALVELVKELEYKKIAGLVIFCGPYIETVPKSVIELADMLNFPIFEIPWEVKLIDITQEICSSIVMAQTDEKATWHLLEEILFFRSDSYENIINRALFYGYDLKGSFQAILCDIDNFKEFLNEKKIKDEGKILEIKNNFRNIVLNTIQRYNSKALSMIQNDSLILLILNNTQTKTEKILKEIQSDVSNQIKDLSVSVGVGGVYSEIDSAKISYTEAEFAINVIKYRKANNEICHYSDLGIFKLLFRINDKVELGRFCNEAIGELINYDKQYATNYVETLDCYVNENFNLAKTASVMFTHKNTLKYRMKRIEEILGFDIHDPSQRLNIQVGLILYKWIYKK